MENKFTDYDKISILKMSLEWKTVEKIANKLSIDVWEVILYLSDITKNQSNISLTETSFKEIVLHYEDLMKKLEIKKEWMSQINNYTELFEKYMKTSVKPDKKYSMLYTTLHYLDAQKSLTALDVWCWTGYFTMPMANQFWKVIWLDNNWVQIKSANEMKIKMWTENIEYLLEDMRTYEYPSEWFDRINAPFVINYSKTINEMKSLFKKRYDALKPWGSLVAIMDNPSDIVHNNKKFWSIKIFPWKQMVDGAIIEMMLYNWDEHLCTLYSCYYTKEIVEKILKEVWFSEVQRKDPLISSEWIQKEWWEFRSNYMRNCDIMYLYAKK